MKTFWSEYECFEWNKINISESQLWIFTIFWIFLNFLSAKYLFCVWFALLIIYGNTKKPFFIVWWWNFTWKSEKHEKVFLSFSSERLKNWDNHESTFSTFFLSWEISHPRRTSKSENWEIILENHDKIKKPTLFQREGCEMNNFLLLSQNYWVVATENKTRHDINHTDEFSSCSDIIYVFIFLSFFHEKFVENKKWEERDFWFTGNWKHF